MILWIIKQLLSLRKAIMGRARPSELAWGLAIGLAIGLVPKGNLISVSLIGLAVSLRINHGMVALSAVLFSFVAMQFDPLTHELGADILGSGRIRQQLDRWWDAPLIPWTDLNNTVVMGSVAISLVSVLPTFLVSLPVFRWLSPRPKDEAPSSDPPPVETPALAIAPASDAVPVESTVVGPDAEAAPLAATPVTEAAEPQPASNAAPEQPADRLPAVAVSQQPTAHVETQIDIIRLSHPLEGEEGESGGEAPREGGTMNEALGYLLRRLRDSRQGKAA